MRTMWYVPSGRVDREPKHRARRPAAVEEAPDDHDGEDDEQSDGGERHPRLEQLEHEQHPDHDLHPRDDHRDGSADPHVGGLLRPAGSVDQLEHAGGDEGGADHDGSDRSEQFHRHVLPVPTAATLTCGGRVSRELGTQQTNRNQ